MLSMYPLLFSVGVGIATAPTTEARYLDGIAGSWDGQFRPSVVFLNMRVDRERSFSTYGRTYGLGELSDMRREKRAVGFELHHSAGTFRFDGAARDLRAAGTFEFIPNTSYRKAAEKLGYRKLDSYQQLTFAVHDVSIDELRQLRRILRGKATAADLARMFERGATPEYVRDLAGVGFSHLAPGELLKVRESGVDADYVRAMRAEGLLLNLPDYMRARRAGLTPEYVGQLQTVGIRDLTLAEYMMLLQHDVSAEYASSLYELGYTFCDLDDLVRLRDQGITASFVRKANKQSGDTLTIGELLRHRTRGEY